MNRKAVPSLRAKTSKGLAAPGGLPVGDAGCPDNADRAERPGGAAAGSAAPEAPLPADAQSPQRAKDAGFAEGKEPTPSHRRPRSRRATRKNPRHKDEQAAPGRQPASPSEVQPQPQRPRKRVRALAAAAAEDKGATASGAESASAADAGADDAGRSWDGQLAPWAAALLQRAHASGDIVSLARVASVIDFPEVRKNPEEVHKVLRNTCAEEIAELKALSASAFEADRGAVPPPPAALTMASDAMDLRLLDFESDEWSVDAYDLFEGALQKLADWRKTLGAGEGCTQVADYWHNDDNRWYEVRVVYDDGREHGKLYKTAKARAPLKGGKTRKKRREDLVDPIRVHFSGWPPPFDEFISRADRLLKPRHAFTVSKAQAPKADHAAKAQKERDALQRYWKAEGSALREEWAAPTAASSSSSSSAPPAGASSSALPPKRRRRQRQQDAPPAEAAKRLKTAEPKKKEMETDDDNEWICAVCNMLSIADEESGEDSPLLCCDGGCLRSFHARCLGLKALPEGDFVCGDCKEGRQRCFACGEYGPAPDAAALEALGGLPEGGVVKCDDRRCGKFYHPDCALALERTQLQEKPLAGGVPRFLCPRHFCDTCGEDRRARKHRQCLVSCHACPAAFHVKCIAPGTRYHELCLLCPEHRDLELPPLRPEDSILHGQEGAALSGAVESVSEASPLLSVLRGLHAAGRRRRKGPSEFAGLPDSVLRSAAMQPPAFRRITQLQYLVRPPRRLAEAEACKCVPAALEGEERLVACGEGCLNRSMFIECVGRSGKMTKRDSEYVNCECGEHCVNRKFQKKAFVKNQVFREGGCGWGLRALEDVAAGSLVMEYLGEVIDDKMMQERFAEHHRLRPHDKNMYVMELAAGFYVDARRKGNVARFINHSCDPNCELQRWNVNGHIRIGIFAVKDIRRNEPFSYDYAFFTSEEARFECRCGAAKCRGTLAAKSRAEMGGAQQGLSRKEELRAARRWHERQIEVLEERERTKGRRLCLTSHMLPGTTEASGDLVADGPKNVQAGTGNGVFLARNLRRGTRWGRRVALLSG